VIDVGDSVTLTADAGPTVCVKEAVPDTLGDTELSVAVIVGEPTDVELVIVAV